MKKDILFPSFRFKHCELRNRIGVAPMRRMSSLEGRFPCQDVRNFLVMYFMGVVGIRWPQDFSK
ncbi:MAG: hypothetical protein PVI06_03675 [Desulfobacterales bacterium]